MNGCNGRNSQSRLTGGKYGRENERKSGDGVGSCLQRSRRLRTICVPLSWETYWGWDISACWDFFLLFSAVVVFWALCLRDYSFGSFRRACGSNSRREEVLDPPCFLLWYFRVFVIFLGSCCCCCWGLM